MSSFRRSRLYPLQGGKDQGKFELRNPVEIWQKSCDCEREIVRENLVEAIPEEERRQIQSVRGQFCEQIVF